MATHFSILAWKIPWTEDPGEGYSPWGHRELDNSPWGRKEPDTTERLT